MIYPINKSSITPKEFPAPKHNLDYGYSLEIEGGETFLFFSKKELMALKKEINKALNGK